MESFRIVEGESEGCLRSNEDGVRCISSCWIMVPFVGIVKLSAGCWMQGADKVFFFFWGGGGSPLLGR